MINSSDRSRRNAFGRLVCVTPHSCKMCPNGSRSSDDTRIWAALQDVSGGAWGGSVYDATAILRVIAAGKRALASEGSSSVPSP